MRIARTILLGVFAAGACKPGPATSEKGPRKEEPRKNELHDVTDIGQGYVLPLDLAFDSTNIYVRSQSMLYRAPIDGGAVADVATDGVYIGLASDATKLYSIRQDAHDPDDEKATDPPEQLVEITKATGARRVLANIDGGLEVVLDESTLYVSALRYTAGPTDEPPPAAILRVPLAGGTPAIVSEQIGDPASLLLHGGALYLRDISGNRILRVPKAGGAATTLATAPDYIGGLAIAGDKLYYTDGDLHEVPLAGGASKVTRRGVRSVLAGTGSSLYFVTPDGIATRLDADGSEHRLTHFPTRATSLAIHGDYLYAALDSRGSPRSGRVVRVAR